MSITESNIRPQTVWSRMVDHVLKFPHRFQVRKIPEQPKPIQETSIMGIYVDDIIITAKRAETIDIAKNDLKMGFKMKDLGNISFMLVIKIHRNREKISIRISQEAYTSRILEKFNMADCKPVSTPNTSLSSFIANDPEPNTTYPFRQAVGAMMYAAISTRTDTMAAMVMTSRRCNEPTSVDVAEVKRVLRYLCGTINTGIILGGPALTNLDIYADADWGSDPKDRRSTTSYVAMLGGPISWRTKRQPTVALSTVEAEYMALSEATQEAVRLRTLLQEAEHPSYGPANIHQDNQGTIALAENLTTSRRTKHIDIRHHFVREQITTGAIKLIFCPTERMIADILTKPVGANC